MLEIIINGTTVEVAENTTVTMSIYSNFMGDLDNIKASRTYTITLPRTRKNNLALGLLSDITAVSVFPYRKYDAQILVDGFEITSKAKAYIASTRNDSIDIIIGWNTTNVFTKLGELKMLDIIELYPALYDSLPFTPSQTFFKPASQIADKKGYFYYIANTANVVDDNVMHTHPCVSARYILELLQTAFNVEFSGLDMNEMNNYLFPCVTKHASRQNRELNGLTMSSVLVSTGSLYRLNPSDIYYPYQILQVYNRNGWMGLSDPNPNRSYYNNTFASSFIIKGKINCSGQNILYIYKYDPEEVALGGMIFKRQTNVSNVIELDDEIKHDGYFVIFLEVRNVVNIVYGHPLLVTPQLDEPKFALRGEFDLLANLPDMKISEFIADICAITGTFPQGAGYSDIDNSRGTLRFVKYSDIGTDNMVDWSGKMSSLKGISYIDSEKSAREVLFDFDHDDEDDVSFGEVVNVDNDIAKAKSDMFDMKLSGMNGNSIKLYAVQVDMSRELNKLLPKIGYKETITISGTDYLQVTGNNANVRFNDNGIVEQRYGIVKDILQGYKVVNAMFNLSPYDIFLYDTSKVVYVNELGSFFMIVSLDYDVKENKADVKMIQIK